MGFWNWYWAITIIWAIIDIIYTANMRYPDWVRCWLGIGLRVPVLWIIMVLIKGAYLIINS